jgi:uncharacterized protein (DUF2252 family)
MRSSGLLVSEPANLVGEAPERPKRSREAAERLQMRNVRSQKTRRLVRRSQQALVLIKSQSGEVGAIVNDIRAARQIIGCSQTIGNRATAFLR